MALHDLKGNNNIVMKPADKGGSTVPPPRNSWGLRPSPPVNPEDSRIIDAVLKRLLMILYTLKYASKTHFKDSVIH